MKKNSMIPVKEAPRKKTILLPTVQLIGAQKAGTSAVADWLFGKFYRPQVFESEPSYYSKEVHYFDINSRYEQGVEFYASRWENASDRSFTLDATPDTLTFAERVRSVYEAAGGNQADTVKMILILREPISRELSLYNHLAFECRCLDIRERTAWHNQIVKDDGSIMSFDDFVHSKSIPALSKLEGPGRSTRHGLYELHLRSWFKLFDRKQILVLSYDELKRDPTKIQERIQSFLGCKIPGALSRSNSNNSKYKIKSPSTETKQILGSIFNSFNENLYQLLKKDPAPLMEQTPFPRFLKP